ERLIATPRTQWRWVTSTPNFQSRTPKAFPTPNSQLTTPKPVHRCRSLQGWKSEIGSSLEVGSWKLGVWSTRTCACRALRCRVFGDELRLRRRRPAAAQAIEEQVDDRRREQGQHLADQQAPDHHEGERIG